MKLLSAVNFLLLACNTSNNAFGKRIGGGSELNDNPLDGGDESDAQDQEMNKKMKRTSRSDDYFYDDDYDYDYYYKYPRKGCRNKHGQKGSEHHEFDVYFQKSRHSCESKCNKLGYECYGYEFGVHDKKCEIWRVPIYDVEYVKGLDCYVKN